MEKLYPRIDKNFQIHFYDDYGSIFKMNNE